jgi:MoaA/NifB/PqqE/SkfB family radical SAM enzyme
MPVSKQPGRVAAPPGGAQRAGAPQPGSSAQPGSPPEPASPLRPSRLVATVDAHGRLVLPPRLAEKLGLLPGATFLLDEEPDSLRIRRPVEQLAKIYVEPTTRCNLTCRTCIRNSWEEPLGDMTGETFALLLQGLSAFRPVPAVLFGGFGEPLAHPQIVEFVSRAKAAGANRVELITNGCLLSRDMAGGLIEAGLDMLWVSLDGIRPESYSDVRLGALLPQVLENLHGFREVQHARRDAASPAPAPSHPADAAAARLPAPQLGIAFVAMKRNIADLPQLLRIGRALGATSFSISNVVPYTRDLLSEILYEDSLEIEPLPTLWHDDLKLVPMDITPATRRALWSTVHGRHEGTLEGWDVSGITRRCPFVEAGTTSVSWTGAVTACQPLLHSHNEYLRGRERDVTRYVVGNLSERSLAELWSEESYVAFRRRVQEFEFSPCISCGGCAMSDANEEDCLDYTFPRCGACLWSQGLIRCP